MGLECWVLGSYYLRSTGVILGGTWWMNSFAFEAK